MDKGLIVDTNVLLTGLFAPNSKSNQVLINLMNRKYSGYVAENSITEAEKAIKRAYENTGVNLHDAFRYSLTKLNLTIIPRIKESEWQAFNKIKGKGDKAIAAAARRISAIICTNDLKDFRNAGEYGLIATTPGKLQSDGSIGLHTLVPGILATPSLGSMYAELRIMSWAQTTFPEGNESKYFIFDSEGIGSLYFFPAENVIKFETNGGPSLSLDYGDATKNNLSVVATYDSSSGASLHMEDDSISVDEQWSPSSLSVGRIHIGNDRNNECQLSGSIRRIFGLPIRINATEAMNIITGKTAHDPNERLSLEDMIHLFMLG